MCLLVPGKIVAIEDQNAVVDYGTETRVGRLIEDGYEVGDYALIQGGIIVSKVDSAEAESALRAYADAIAAKQTFSS